MPDDFARRIKELRERRKLSQNELAAAAGLSPATFSRLLSGERPLRMDQAVALARALGVTVIELTAGTTAEGVIAEWVPRQDYQAADRLRADAEREVELLKREATANVAENASLRDGVRLLTSRVAELESELSQSKAEAARAVHLAKKNAEQLQEILTLNGKLARLRSDVEQLQGGAAAMAELANRNYQAWAAVKAQLATLEKTLVSEKSEKVGVAFVAAALGALAAGMASSPAETRGRRKS
jgi:transcriptional regulator with XRE-family HTH domain